MDEKLTVLQIGRTDWSKELDEINKDFAWEYVNYNSWDEEEINEILDKRKGFTFDTVVISSAIPESLLDIFNRNIEAFRLVVDKELEDDPIISSIKKLKEPIFLDFNDKLNVILFIKKNLFPGQSGSKLHTDSILVNDKFNGEIELDGESYLRLNGDFSELGSTSLLSWKSNVFMHDEKNKDLWLEFYHSENIDITLRVAKVIRYSARISEIQTYTEDEIKKGITIENNGDIGYLAVSIIATGNGKLNIGPLHNRDSRNGFGDFFPGGNRMYDDRNQELLYYFHPGDLKPPLNVYFSGFRTAEGFEGFYMMRSLGAPYILISDPRLEGGSFYVGSEQLENSVPKVIKQYLKYLGFSNKELILSGLSMGSFASMYYATKLKPRYVINGKPLASIGTTAENTKIKRPGDFSESLDMLNLIEGDLSKESIDKFNKKFWDTIVEADFAETDFASAYMLNDDYDSTAYPTLLKVLSKKKGSIIGKGILGRHNDNSSSVNQWFINQFKRILNELYNRKF